MKNANPNPDLTKKLQTILFAIVVVGILLTSIYTVPAGHRGVLLTFGAPSLVAKDEGIGFKIPFAQQVVKMSVQTQKYVAGATAASKDLQIVTTELAVNFHLVPESVPLVYQEIGLSFEDRVIQPAVQEVVKAVTAEFTAEELITKRPDVNQKISAALKEKLKDRSLIIEEISITNFEFSPAFNDAIEAKVTAEQLKLKAERDLERIEIEAKQTIEQAKAAAEALRLQRAQVSADLIALREVENQKLAIEKWDGVLPKVTGGAMPFIDIAATIEE